MKKKYYIIIIVLVLLILQKMTVWADDAGNVKYSYGHFYYHTHDGYVSICGYLGKEAQIKIPSVISGKPVSEIESRAFDGCDTIQVVNVPDTVDTIHDDSFQGMFSLVKIISDTVGVEIKAKDGVEILYTSTQNTGETADTTAVKSGQSETKTDIASEKTGDDKAIQSGKDDGTKESTSKKVTKSEGSDDKQIDTNASGEATGKKNTDNSKGTGSDTDGVITKNVTTGSDSKNTAQNKIGSSSNMNAEKPTGSEDKEAVGNDPEQDMPDGMGEYVYIEPEPESAMVSGSDDKDTVNGTSLKDEASSITPDSQEGAIDKGENANIADETEESVSQNVGSGSEKSSRRYGRVFAVIAGLIILVMGVVAFVLIKRQ